MIVHDMTKRGWGNDLSLRPHDKDPATASATGWRTGISAGDHMMLSNPASGLGFSFYLVESIEYYSDPPDMWNATLKWIPIEKCKHLITNQDALAVLNEAKP